MNVRRVNVIYRKDLRDAMRDSRLIMAVLMPLLLGLLYSVMFKDQSKPQAKLGYVSAAESVLPAKVKDEASRAVVLRLQRFGTEAELRRQVREESVDAGLVIPDGFDQSLADGRSPRVIVVLPASPTFGGDYAVSLLDRATQAMSGRLPPAKVAVVTLPPKSGTTDAALQALGTRKVFVLLALIILLAMIAAYALPAVLTEEREKRTFDALALIASDGEVIAAKALFGLTYCAIGIPLMLLVTRAVPEDVALFVATMAATAIVLVGLGLLMGGLMKSQSQLNNWSSVLLLPLMVPAITIGFPTPAAVNAVVYVIPTSQTVRLGVNAFAGRAVFGGELLSFAVLAAWAVAVYGVLLWRLSRQEAA